MEYFAQGGRFVGTTQECFEDLINRFTGLRIHALLAEFCLPTDRDKQYVGIDKVQRWQRGEYFPGGEALLRLRCFLHLAGYEVTEHKKLTGDAQKLALIVGIGLADPMETVKHLGYEGENPLNSLWRILLQGGGYTTAGKDNVNTRMKKLIRQHRQALILTTEIWERRIKGLLDELAPAPVSAPQPATQLPPGISSSFARLIGATTALATTLLSYPDAQRAAVEATRGGHDLKELIGVLQQFFPDEEGNNR